MTTHNRHDPSRSIRAPRGNQLTCKSWLTEAPFRMLQNNLDAEVAEDPASLVVYGGIGRAARDWACYDKILDTLKTLGDDETLLVQSGKPVGVFPTHADAPRVLIANSNLVPHWATWEHFNELDKKGLMMYGQRLFGHTNGLPLPCCTSRCRGFEFGCIRSGRNQCGALWLRRACAIDTHRLV